MGLGVGEEALILFVPLEIESEEMSLLSVSSELFADLKREGGTREDWCFM